MILASWCTVCMRGMEGTRFPSSAAAVRWSVAAFGSRAVHGAKLQAARTVMAYRSTVARQSSGCFVLENPSIMCMKARAAGGDVDNSSKVWSFFEILHLSRVSTGDSVDRISSRNRNLVASDTHHHAELLMDTRDSVWWEGASTHLKTMERHSHPNLGRSRSGSSVKGRVCQSNLLVQSGSGHRHENRRIRQTCRSKSNVAMNGTLAWMPQARIPCGCNLGSHWDHHVRAQRRFFVPVITFATSLAEYSSDLRIDRPCFHSLYLY